MSKSVKLCPNCGTKLFNKKICPNCGIHVSSIQKSQNNLNKNANQKRSNKYSEITYEYENAIWRALSPHFPQFSRYISMILLIGNLIFLFFAWFPFVNQPLPVLELIMLIGNLMIIGLYIQPFFVRYCVIEEYEKIINDAILIKNFRFPKCLFFGILTSIFDYWFGLALLIPAIILVFLSPFPFQWKIDT